MEQVIARYWSTLEARDWSGFGALLSEDVVYELPQTRERIRGRANYVRFNAEYPDGWHLSPQRIVAGARQAATLVRCAFGGELLDVATYFDLDDEARIARIVEYWPEPYAPPSRGGTASVESY